MYQVLGKVTIDQALDKQVVQRYSTALTRKRATAVMTIFRKCQKCTAGRTIFSNMIDEDWLLFAVCMA